MNRFWPLAALLCIVATAALAAPDPGWPDLKNVPAATGGGANDAALIVDIQDYDQVPDVVGATRNGDDWYRWLGKTRQVPLPNVRRVSDGAATRGQILKEAEEAARRVREGGTLWVVFIGHGFPGEGGEPLLVGVDARPSRDSLLDRSVGRSELLAVLNKGAQAETVMVLDACFSGQTATGDELVTGFQSLAPVADLEPTASATVLTAASAGQVAGRLPGEARPAFSYLVLGGLYGWADDPQYGGDGDGYVTATEAVEYANGALVATSKDNRAQQPRVEGAHPDVVLAQGRARGPDLWEMGIGVEQTVGASLPGAGEVVLEGEVIDYAAIAAEVEAANREEELARIRAEEARKERDAIREKELARLTRETQAKATKDWSHIEPLLGSHTERTEEVVRSYVTTYEGAKVRFDGVERSVPIPEVAEAKVWLDVAPTSSPRAVPTGTTYTNSVGAVLVKIPAGRFTMGSPSAESGRDDDEGQVQVELTRSFWLMTTEVTQGQYRTVTGENPSHFKGDDLPVEKVSWLDAVNYANALSEREDLSACYGVIGTTVTWPEGLSCTGYRLPTEGEWEYAARGGEGHVYSGSDTLSAVGWYTENSGSTTHAVGGKAPNAFGLYDMTGNVWEWVWDWYGSTLPGGRDPLGPEAGSFRVFRGGSWFNSALYLRVAYRGWHYPDYRGTDFGFRLARTSP